MAGPDAPVADSSPAVAATPSLPDLSALSETDLAHWRMTGDVPATPAPEPTTPEADSSPAEPADQAASTDAHTQPASEPGKPSKSNAETRKTELAREIEDLLAKRNALLSEIREREARQPARTDAKPVESSPTTVPDLAQTVQRPDLRKPALTDTEFFAQFPDATLSDFTDYRFNYHADKRASEGRVQSERQSRLEAFQARNTEAETASPGWWSKLDPRVQQLPTRDLAAPGETITPLHDVGQHILTSPVGPKLLTYLSEHVTELDRLAALRSPLDVARELGKLEAKLDTTAPPIKPVSSAPPPPSTLGSKPATAAADEVDEAIREGNFERYRASMNRRELATAR